MYTSDCKDPNCISCRQICQEQSCETNQTEIEKMTEEMTSERPYVFPTPALSKKKNCLEVYKLVQDEIRFKFDKLSEILRTRERFLLEQVEYDYFIRMSEIDRLEKLSKKDSSNMKELFGSRLVFACPEMDSLSLQLSEFGHLDYNDIKDIAKLEEERMKKFKEDCDNIDRIIDSQHFNFTSCSKPFKGDTKTSSGRDINDMLLTLKKRVEKSNLLLQDHVPESDSGLDKIQREACSRQKIPDSLLFEAEKEFLRVEEKMSLYKQYEAAKMNSKTRFPDLRRIKRIPIQVEEKDELPKFNERCSINSPDYKQMKPCPVDENGQLMKSKVDVNVPIPDVKQMIPVIARKTKADISLKKVWDALKPLDKRMNTHEEKMIHQLRKTINPNYEIPEVMACKDTKVIPSDDDDMEIISLNEAASIPFDLPPPPPIKPKKRSIFGRRNPCFPIMPLARKSSPEVEDCKSGKSDTCSVSESESSGEYNAYSAVQNSAENFCGGGSHDKGNASSSEQEDQASSSFIASDEKANPSAALLSSFLKYLEKNAEDEWLASAKASDQPQSYANSCISDKSASPSVEVLDPWLSPENKQEAVSDWLFKAHMM